MLRKGRGESHPGPPGSNKPPPREPRLPSAFTGNTILGTSPELTLLGPGPGQSSEWRTGRVLKGGGPELPLTSDLSRCVFTDSTFR